MFRFNELLRHKARSTHAPNWLLQFASFKTTFQVCSELFQMLVKFGFERVELMISGNTDAARLT